MYSVLFHHKIVYLVKPPLIQVFREIRKQIWVCFHKILKLNHKKVCEVSILVTLQKEVTYISKLITILTSSYSTFLNLKHLAY